MTRTRSKSFYAALLCIALLYCYSTYCTAFVTNNNKCRAPLKFDGAVVSPIQHKYHTNDCAHDHALHYVRKQSEENQMQMRQQPATTMDEVSSAGHETEGAFITKFPTVIPEKLSSLFSFDKGKAAKVGVAFALTYSLISNINGSISLSLAWFIASKKTGLSPLAPGQWKTLLAAYGGLYIFISLVRPLRIALAVSMTKKTEQFLDYTRDRLGCSRATAIGVQITLNIMLWVACAAGGVTLASVFSGVPIWKQVY